MKICDSNKCTGCGACANVCLKKCITMRADCYGELHPFIDSDKCIQCRKCVRTCPSNSNVDLIEPKVVYASWRTDQEKMKDSASGGIGAALAENWVKQGGVVFGTKFDESFHVVLCEEHTLDGIEAFKGSKYVQSYTGTSFSDVKRLTANGTKVLYFGTPCQLAGLYAVVDRDNPNFVTVEILCHGVSSDAYLQEELEAIKKRIGNKRFDRLTFRTNKWMMDFYLGLWKGDEVVFSEQAYENEYFRGFLTGLTLRESCYQCLYKNTARIGDLCIGDFIGFGKHIPYEGEKARPSLILVMTEKGEKILNLANKDIILVERTMEEALIEGRSLRESFPRHEKQEEFRNNYKEKGFLYAVDSTIGNEIIEEKKRNRVVHIKRKIKLAFNSIFGIRIQNGRIYHGN